MSAQASTKHAYLAMLPDFTEGSKRMSVREQHLANAAKLHEDGTLIQGGALLSADPATSEQQQMTGSFMLFYAENIDKAREMLDNDVYTKGGAWDMSKATITPVRVAKH